MPPATDRGELWDWFEERFGRVTLIEMCHDNGEYIQLCQQRAEIEQQREVLTQRRLRQGFTTGWRGAGQKPVGRSESSEGVDDEADMFRLWRSARSEADNVHGGGQSGNIRSDDGFGSKTHEPDSPGGVLRTGPFLAELDLLDKHLADIDDQIRVQHARREALQHVDKHHNELPEGVAPLQTISAFVTFETDESFELAMHWQRVAALREPRRRSDPTGRGLGGRDYYRTGYQIHLKEAPEPDAVIWTNLEHGDTERSLRRIAVNAAVVVVLLVSFGLITGLSASKLTLSHLQHCENILRTVVNATGGKIGVCEMHVVNTQHELVTNSSSWDASTSSVSPEVFKSCFEAEQNKHFRDECLDFEKFAVLERYRPNQNVHSLCYQCHCSVGTPAATALEGGSYCDDLTAHLFVSQLMAVGITVVVVCVNQAMKTCFHRLVDFERPQTIGGKESSVMVKLFLAQLFNTGLLVLILNTHEKRLGWLGSLLQLLRSDNATYHEDFTNDWFDSIGKSILQSMVIQTITPPILRVLTGLFGRWSRNAVRRQTLFAAHKDRNGGIISWATRCGYAASSDVPSLSNNYLNRDFYEHVYAD
eukprot:COSAG05_NODE_1029_length_6096_cov_10.323002_3_plen_590_part_00